MLPAKRWPDVSRRSNVLPILNWWLWCALARQAGSAFQVFKQAEGFVHPARVVVHFSLGGEYSREFEFRVEDMVILWVPDKKLLYCLALDEQLVSRQKERLLATGRFLSRSRIQRDNILPIFLDGASRRRGEQEESEACAEHSHISFTGETVAKIAR